MLDQIIGKIKKYPNFDRVGMIDFHVGVVRGMSRNGKEIEKLKVIVDRSALDYLLEKVRNKPGIVAVEIFINEGMLNVGDTIMILALAGDIREHVFPLLIETVNTIKKNIIKEEEFFKK